MDADRHGCRWFDPAWFLVWALASSAWCLTAADHLSATFDEPFYLRNGLHAWRTGSYHGLLKAGTMPLPVDVETLPVYVWEQCRGRSFDPTADFDQILPVARAGNLVFWWLLLAYGCLLGRLYGGRWGGRLAVLLLACEPNLLAHACLATTDIAAAACLLAFIYHYQVGRTGGWWRRAGVPGICYGMAILAKASALAFGPVAMIALDQGRQWAAASARCRPGAPWREWWGIVRRNAEFFPRQFWTIIGIGLALTFAYCASDFRTEQSFVIWAQKLPEGTPRRLCIAVAENLPVFPNAGSGLAYQIKHNVKGHGCYLLGDWHPRAVAYYFPVALLIKLSLPALALTGVFVLCRPRSLVSPLAMLLLVLLFFSLSCRVQIGIRLVSPLVCVWMIVLAAGVSRALAGIGRWQASLTAALACLFAVAPLSVWPDGLRYVNPLWGGPESGYRLLSDSNYDWGQGLKELRAWRDAHGDPPMKIWYYGMDPGFLRSAEHCPLHNMPIESPADVYKTLGGHYLAVGASILYRDPFFTPAGAQTFAVLRGMKPIARTSTFFIYDFTESPPAACAP